MSAGAASQPSPNGLHWSSVIQFAFSGLVLGGLWGMAGVSIFSNLLSSGSQTPNAPGPDWFAPFGYFTLGLLLLPSTILSLRRVAGLPSREVRIPGGRFGLSIFLIPLFLTAGYWLFISGLGGWVAPLHILVGLLSVGWLLWLAIRNLSPGSGQRSWGALGAGMALTPLFALALELIAAIFLIVILAIYVGTNPELANTLERVGNLADRINPNVELIVENLQPLFNDPFVLILALFGLGVIVPLIEELFKPLGVMLLLGRKLTPAQGFALGALCGAGYALAENLAIGTTDESWALITVGRFGTSAMHILTAALSGYALVRAKNERRYLALFGIYLLNVSIHGIWNSLVVLSTATLVGNSANGGALPFGLICIAPVLLAVLALTCLLLLRRYNHRLSLVTTSDLSPTGNINP